ncbi:MAG: phosphatase domain-containing protein [Acidobacteriota bacterium]
MVDWRSKIVNILSQVDDLSDAARARVEKIKGRNDPLKILPYLGYGSTTRVCLNGRVLEDEGIGQANAADTIWENLVNMYKRFESDEVAGARVCARFLGDEVETITDNDGYFSFSFQPTSLPYEHLWHDVELELLDPQPLDGKLVKAIGKVLLPSSQARFGVISDIDDTVIQTNVGNKLKMILGIALLNARTRLPFKGVAGFYNALQQGSSGKENNPIFYISSSPWNLYDPLIEFLEIHGIPIGPLFLKDFGEQTILDASNHFAHKTDKIERLLALYPHLPFILIGDNGEQDPEIYTTIVSKYPDRVRVIYIRSVNTAAARIDAINRLVAEVSKTGCQLVLAQDSESVAIHAAGEGLISLAGLDSVRAQSYVDEYSPNAREVVDEE